MQNRGIFLRYLTNQMGKEENSYFIVRIIFDKLFAKEFIAYKNSEDCKNFMKDLSLFLAIVKEISENYSKE